MIIHIQEIKETRTVKLKSVNMYPKNPAKDIQLRKPAATGKNCKATICENTNSKSQSTVKCVFSGKKCQENNVMQSVTKKMNMWLPKPAVPYEYRRMYSDNNCQSTRCYRSPMRPMYD